MRKSRKLGDCPGNKRVEPDYDVGNETVDYGRAGAVVASFVQNRLKDTYLIIATVIVFVFLFGDTPPDTFED